MMSRRVAYCCISSFLFCLIFPTHAWAIPSPDIVVNLFGSVAQLLGLSTVLLGAGFASRSRINGSHSTITAGWKYLFVAAGVMLTLSLAANLLQFSYNKDETTKRLQTNLWRSSTEAGKAVGDISLKTLAFSDQQNHPRGITTDTLQGWLDNGHGLNIIDVRESEEYETGYIKGARQSRYPDTRVSVEKLILPDKENVLLCYSGNRSSELCSEFTEQGLPCRFVIGGYEKWVAEERELVGFEQGERNNLRMLPEFPNSDVLLKTAVVEELVANENALFVDLRYPADFERGHLPGAVNIPVRKLTTAELDLALKELPKHPVITPCYDKRSCFYSQILGLKLSRLGYDYRGRYTVPHEYSTPSSVKGYVAQWRDMQSQTLFDLATSPLQEVLAWMKAKSGSLTLSIFLLVVLLRLIVLPISLKAERDGVRQRELKPSIDALKKKYGDNKARLSRATLRLYKKNGLTHGRNVLGSFVQLGVFILFFSAVSKVSEGVNEPFLWVTNLGEADPTRIMPSIVGALMFAQIMSSTINRSLKFKLLYLGLAAFVAVLCMPLNAAVSLYLIFSLGFILLQTHIVQLMAKQKSVSGTRLRHVPPPGYAGTVSLRDAQDVPYIGNKAGRLAQMRSAGFAVPDGFVITDQLLSRARTQVDGTLSMIDKDQKLINTAFSRLDVGKVAVRSTAVAEDGSEQSFAGVFDSVLNVKKEHLLDAVAQVRGSYNNGRVEAYNNESHGQGCVLVQAMVDAEYAGVLFTQHPTSTGCMLIEMVQGLGESLVSGKATPSVYSYGAVSGLPMSDDQQSPIDLLPLMTIARQIEELFACPQDIEWAYAKGRYYILQARDITISAAAAEGNKSVVERERLRLMSLFSGTTDAATPVLQQNELSELLPEPSPLSLSVMQALWDENGSTDIACQRLGIPYNVDEDDSAAYVVTAFGQTYVNVVEGRRRFGAPGAMASFRLSRAADAIEEEFRSEFLPRLISDMRIREALDLTHFSFDELLGLLDQWLDRFLHEDYIHAEIINIAADFYMKTAKQALAKYGLEAASYLGHGPETIQHQALNMLPAIKTGERPLEDFLKAFGYRALHDYELAEPRYQENEVLIEQMVDASKPMRSPTAANIELPDNRLLRINIERARRFQSLKEDAKHYCMREFSSIRTLLLEISRRKCMAHEIFYLTIDEVMKLHRLSAQQIAQLVGSRQHEREVFKAVNLPLELSLHALEGLRFDVNGGLMNAVDTAGALMGTWVAGDSEVQGTIRIVDEDSMPESLHKDDILVVKYTDPRWIPLFDSVSGVVTEIGGFLSHMSIVAREYNIPCIVGVNGATFKLEEGQVVKLGTNGFIDRRIAARRQTQSSEYSDTTNRRTTDRRANTDTSSDKPVSGHSGTIDLPVTDNGGSEGQPEPVRA